MICKIQQSLLQQTRKKNVHKMIRLRAEETKEQSYISTVIAPMRDFWPARTSNDFVDKKLWRSLSLKAVCRDAVCTRYYTRR